MVDKTKYMGDVPLNWLNWDGKAGSLQSMSDQGGLNFLPPDVAAYLQAQGFSGPLMSQGQIAPTDRQEYQGHSSQQGYSMSPEVVDFLNKQGIGLRQGWDGDMRVGQAVGKDGKVLAADVADQGDTLIDKLAKAAIVGGMGYGLGGAAGLWDIPGVAGAGLGETAALGADQVAALGGEMGSGGIGTLGAGTELGYTALPNLTGLGAMSPEALAAISVPEVALPTFGAAAGGAAGGALGSADKAAMFGAEGYGPGMTGLQTSAYDGVLGLTGSKALADVAGTAAGTGLGSLIGNTASGLGSVVSALGGAGTLVPLIGAVTGAASGGGTQTATTQQKMDPRMEAYIYGSGKGDKDSLLGAAWNQFQANPSGINPTMQAGLDMQKAALTDPAYGQAYSSMRDLGGTLMGGGVAGNPFTRQAQPQTQPQMPAGGGNIPQDFHYLTQPQAPAGGGNIPQNFHYTTQPDEQPPMDPRALVANDGGGFVPPGARMADGSPFKSQTGLLGIPQPAMQAGGAGGLIGGNVQSLIARARGLI